MKLTIFALSVLVTFSFIVFSGENSKKAPEGVELKGDDSAVAKPGYEFYRVNNRQVASRRKASSPGGKNITGTYECSCSQGQGYCGADLTPTTLTCIPRDGCTKCQLKVTISKMKIVM